MLDAVFIGPNEGRIPALAALTILLFVFCSLLYRNKRPRPLPPGPPGRFLVGNLGQVNLDRPEQDYIRWGQQYGESLEGDIGLARTSMAEFRTNSKTRM